METYSIIQLADGQWELSVTVRGRVVRSYVRGQRESVESLLLRQMYVITRHTKKADAGFNRSSALLDSNDNEVNTSPFI